MQFDMDDPFASTAVAAVAPSSSTLSARRPPICRTSSNASTASLPTPPTSSDNELSDNEQTGPRTPTKQLIPSASRRIQSKSTRKAKNVDRIERDQKTPSPKYCPPRYHGRQHSSEMQVDQDSDIDDDDPFAAPGKNDRLYRGQNLSKSQANNRMTSYVFRGKKIQLERPLAAASLSDSEEDLISKAVPRFLFPEARPKMTAPVSPTASIRVNASKPATPPKAKIGDLIPPTPQSNVRRKRKPGQHGQQNDHVQVYRDELTLEEREAKKQRLRAEMTLVRRVGGSAEMNGARVLFQ